jgi:hypothetical protein
VNAGVWWAGKTAAEVTAAAGSRPESWAAVPGYSRYEWSDQGSVRSVPYRSGGRQLTGRLLKTRQNNSGYVIVGVVRDSDGKQVTVAVHAMVLLAHHPAFRGLAAFPAGLETRHGPAGPLCNAYPENLWPGTKAENEADKEAPPEPQHPCRNFASCRNLVYNEGRRCVPCTQDVGRGAAELLRAGANLMTVAEKFGYTGPDWVFKLAAQYGGYEGTKADALAQQPSLRQRVRLRGLLKRGDSR